MANGEEVTKLEEQIFQQVEYYFGDANLRKDKFMKQTLDENDGWMPMETLLKFNRLKKLSEDTAVVAAALRKSLTGLLEVAEDGSKVRRSLDRPVPDWSDSVKKDTYQRTVYAKGFPTTHKLEDVESFLESKGFGKSLVSNIVMRRRLESREFKGSVFVEFANQEAAQKFLATEHTLEGSEAPLLCLSRTDYYKKKEDERKELKGKMRESALAAAREVAEEKEEEELKFEPGCVLSFDKCSESTTRESLKELFGKTEEIQWVNFTKGDTCGKVRFTSAGGAERALEAVKKDSEDGVVCTSELTLCFLEFKLEHKGLLSAFG